MAKHRVDFTGVESYLLCEEGEHIVQFDSYEETTSKDGDVQFKSTFLVIAGTSKGARIIENFTLNSKALWKLKMFLEAVGVAADKKMVIDPDAWVGKKCIVEVNHREYNGQARSNISSYKKLIATKKKADEVEEDEDGFDEEEEETPPAKKEAKPKAAAPAAKKTAKKKEPEPEEDDDDWEDE